MFSFDKFKLSNFIFIEIEFYFLISIKVIFAAEFIDIKKLSNTDSIYFTVLDTGLFLYDFDNKDYSLIHQFNSLSSYLLFKDYILLVHNLIY